MAASSVTFAEKLAAQDEDFHEGITRLRSKPYTISLQDEELETVQHVLQYIYRVFPPRKGPAKVQSQQEAEHLASFGHKYDVQYLLHASDAFMHDVLEQDYRLYAPSTADVKSYNSGLVESAQSKVQEVLRLCSLAESKGLQRTEDYCSKWLAHFIKSYSVHVPDLVGLSKGSLIKVLTSISKA